MTAGTNINTSSSRCSGRRLPIAVAYVFVLMLPPALADGPPTDPNWRPTKPSYDHVPPDIRQWFRDQQEPKSGLSCCNEADGGQAQEEIRNGKYWASWCLVGNSQTGECARSSGWIEVPDDVVIQGPNRAGHPVVWSYLQGGKHIIRCYSPGVKSDRVPCCHARCDKMNLRDDSTESVHISCREANAAFARPDIESWSGCI